MDEVNSLLHDVFDINAVSRISYQGLFEFYLKLNVLTCSDDEIKSCGQQVMPSLPANFDTDRDGWLDLLMGHVIEPRLATMNWPLFVYDFPASQAQLAKIKPDQQGQRVADRFELYIDGVEIANGYNELLDADELRQRFEEDNQQREQQGKAQTPIDENLLSAMRHGLPECSGVAVGLDRLIMLAMGKKTINAVQSFELS